MGWRTVVEQYGFEWQAGPRELLLPATNVWRRGDLWMLERIRPFQIFVDEGGPEIEFRVSPDAEYSGLGTVLHEIGAEWRYGDSLDPWALLEKHMDDVFVWARYTFLLDRGFQVERYVQRGGGCYTLVLRRHDLFLTIEVDGDQERIDLNAVPLAEILRANGVEGSRVEDLRKHADLIPNAVLTVTAT